MQNQNAAISNMINTQRKPVVSRTNYHIPSTIKKVVPELEEDEVAIEMLRSPMLGVMRTSVDRSALEVKKSESKQNTPRKLQSNSGSRNRYNPTEPS